MRIGLIPSVVLGTAVIGTTAVAVGSRKQISQPKPCFVEVFPEHDLRAVESGMTAAEVAKHFDLQTPLPPVAEWCVAFTYDATLVGDSRSITVLFPGRKGDRPLARRAGILPRAVRQYPTSLDPIERVLGGWGVLRVPMRARPRCAPFAFRSWGQSLKAAFAAEPRGGLK